MILNSHLPIKAWLDPQSSRLPGVAPVAIEDWLSRSDTYDRQIAYRRDLIKRARDAVFQTTSGAEAASSELRDIICTETNYPKSSSEHPLLDVASHVQEDLCIFAKTR